MRDSVVNATFGSIAIHVALAVITLGGQRVYLTRYHTVLFGTLWVPDAWDEMSDDDKYVGRFSEGEEALGAEDPEKHHVGRFSQGEEVLGDEDPEKDHVGRFSEGEEVLLEEPRP